ncbi:MAG: zinc ribbon domain-containing protein, partial [Clostridia bacterium]|nr:zinc ribbon domain-containing protein [Clostridia bacterium]
MKCPKCGMQNSPSAQLCRRCKEPLPKAEEVKTAEQTLPVRHHGPLFWIICYLIMIPVAVLGLYKAYFWLESWQSSRPYTSGSVAYAQVESIKMDHNKPGHAVTIFGSDGDTVYIDELGQGYVILGGLVRIEVEDSFWFDRDPETIAMAKIQLTPTLYRENGTMQELPIIEYEVETPYTPVTLTSPSSPTETVYSSVYQLEMNVVPGSTVLINGEDISDTVDREGLVTANVNVYPQGNNRISLYASTPHHKDTRMDIVLYRPVMEVALELSANTQYTSTRSLLEIRGG